MRRFTVSLVATAALMVATSGIALADRGAPGATFPEQPGARPATACANVTTNPGTGIGGASGAVISPTAAAITTGLLTDGCFGG